MKTFRVVELSDVTKQDFYDVPFWVHSNGRYVWVAMQYRIEGAELHSYVALYEVHDNVVQPTRVLASDNNTAVLLNGLRRLYNPFYGVSTNQLRRMFRNPCECEVGEPCYCNL